jgi:putative glutamine amidotransferase
MSRPVIGVVTQTQEALPDELPPLWIAPQRYVRLVGSLGAVPWLIPLLPADPATLRAIYDRIDGLFLTGGRDVDPSTYGELRHPRCGATDPDRDAVELTFIRWALEDRKPILAVCRGIQILNVACGGNLYQDIDNQYPPSIRHDYFPSAEGTPARDFLAHEVRVDRRTRLGGCLGAERVPVNSMHHQGINALAATLVATAWAPDGLIEAVEGANGQYVVGVQWHPEELTADAGQRAIFMDYLENCSRKR